MNFYSKANKTILIFDLDGTICKSTLNTPSKVNRIVQMIQKYVHYKNGSVYVVTARRLSDFKSEYDLLSYNVPKEIVNVLMSINKNKMDRWLYYNDYDDHSNQTTYQVLHSENKLNEYNNFLSSSYKPDLTHLNLGMQKQMQIEDILHKYPANVQVFFFDDARHNKYAWLFYSDHINPHFKNITFIGGNDQPVF